jgi:glycosyltransferase involved in cell wall biosynthesis
MDGPPWESVTVITVTRGRPEELTRAIASVQAQDYRGDVLHEILVDDDPSRYEAVCRRLLRASVPRRTQSWRFAAREPGEQSGPARIAKLRNEAVARATSRLVAFLDDDNEFERHHLTSLLSCMRQTGCPAVHSQRLLLHPTGAPYVEERMPWKRDPDEGRAVYEHLRRRHVFVRGSNVVRDQADPRTAVDRVQMVDTSEWLFERQLLLRIPFCVEYDYGDWAAMVPEDNKLLTALVENDAPLASTHMPTLRYYLGGYSNTFASSPGGAPVWCAD